jgi:hypothetical protein
LIASTLRRRAKPPGPVTRVIAGMTFRSIYAGRKNRAEPGENAGGPFGGIYPKNHTGSTEKKISMKKFDVSDINCQIYNCYAAAGSQLAKVRKCRCGK